MSFQKSIRMASLLFLLFSLSTASSAQRRDDDRRRGDEGRWEISGDPM
ncbi:MAG: hypothetical protein AABN34_15880 [Acidobacteriota bacterium]